MTDRPRLAIMIPYYDDAEALAALLPRLHDVLDGIGMDATLIVLDDGSPVPAPIPAATERFARRVVVRLRVNLGHQRAIAVGLALVADRFAHDLLLIMDGDGEDRPEDIPALLAAATSDSARIIFAERTRRSEGLAFALAYRTYRWLHRAMTGHAVRFGNFSVVPWPCLERLVGSPRLWNHYAAAVISSRIPYVGVPTVRGRRLRGRSTMNWTALTVHGLSALAVFSDIIGVRLLVANGLAGVVLTGVLIRLADRTGPMASTALLVAGFLVVGCTLGTLAFTFVILAGRQNATFVPLRDYSYFILDTESA